MKCKSQLSTNLGKLSQRLRILILNYMHTLFSYIIIGHKMMLNYFDLQYMIDFLWAIMPDLMKLIIAIKRLFYQYFKIENQKKTKSQLNHPIPKITTTFRLPIYVNKSAAKRRSHIFILHSVLCCIRNHQEFHLKCNDVVFNKVIIVLLH